MNIKLTVNIISFGFKHKKNIPADIQFDVRFLPNPYYQPELKNRTGLDKVTSAYAIDNKQGDEFFRHLEPLLLFLTSQYDATGRDSYTIAIGCTGGKHRSVAVAEKLGELLKNKGINVSINHRDLHLN